MTEMQYYGTGKRKTSVARVYLRSGAGNIIINKKALGDYFPNETEQVLVRKPLEVTETTELYDVWVNVRGGGKTGQAEAIRHGLSRALTLVPQEEFRAVLKKAGLKIQHSLKLLEKCITRRIFDLARLYRGQIRL